MIKGNEHLFTEKGYLELEETAQVRRELYHGNLIEMPGGTIFHESLILNISFMLKSFFSISDYKVFVSGLKLKISPDKY